VGRNAALAAGLPEHVPGMTIDRQCGSSQQAIQSAAAAIIAGYADIVVAGGVEVMSRADVLQRRGSGSVRPAHARALP
jgi:acetyl-CoA acyltransferase